MVGYWLLKSDTDSKILKGIDVSYRWDQMQKDGTVPWFGVRNYRARNFIRDQIKQGDFVFFFASSCKVPGIVGVCEVVKGPYPDPDASTKGHPYYDEKHTAESPRWYSIDIAHRYALDSFVPNRALTSDAVLQQSDMLLLKIGRLSVQPVKPAEWNRIHELGNTKIGGGPLVAGGSSSSNGSSSGANASNAAPASAAASAAVPAAAAEPAATKAKAGTKRGRQTAPASESSSAAAPPKAAKAEPARKKARKS
jgi:predicted RNA-binding protein with PUA-like domain